MEKVGKDGLITVDAYVLVHDKKITRKNDLLPGKLIRDPTKVTRTDLQNAAAAAAAGLLLTTECVVVEKRQKVPAIPAGEMGGMY